MPNQERDELIRRLVAEFEALRAKDPATDARGFSTSRCGGDAALEADLLSRLGSSADAPTRAPADEFGGTVILGDDEPPPPEKGLRIDGRYVVERMLGEGGFGVVYLVRDEVHRGNLRALKTLRAALTADTELVQRFRNEIITLKAVSHRYVPKFHNDGRTEDGDLYYVMDYVDGVRLDDLLRKEGALAPDRIVNIVRQVLEVLDFAHEKGVFHRDLKPANLILVKAGTPDEEVRVLDFGIAKIDSSSEEFNELESLHTMQGGAIGTPHYMAPEQVDGRGGIDGKTDLYALGVIVYQMCSGRVPFTGKTSMEVAAARLTQAPPPLDESTPAWLRDLVMRLLERQKERRPGTRELRLELDHISKGQREIKRLATWIAAGILVIALGVAALLWKDAPDPVPLGDVDGPGNGQSANVSPTKPPDHGADAAKSDQGQSAIRTPTAPPPVAFISPAEGLRSASPDIEVVLDARGRKVVAINDNPVATGSDGVARTTVRAAADQESTITVRDEEGKELAARRVVVDTRKPELQVGVPDGVVAKGGDWLTSRQRIVVSGTLDDGKGGLLAAQPLSLAGGAAVPVDATGAFETTVELQEGRQDFGLRAVDSVGLAASFGRGIVSDRTRPAIEFSTSAAPVESDRVRLSGAVRDALACSARLVRDGKVQDLPLDAGGGFSIELPLAPGLNEATVEAVDEVQNSSSAVFRVERRRAQFAIASVAPESGRVLPAKESSVRVAATANQRASKVDVTRNGASLAVQARPSGDGFELDLPLVFGANLFRLVPYGDDGTPGAPFELSYVRSQPAAPAGCTLPDDVELDAGGRPRTVLHERSGLVFLLVPGELGRAPFYIARNEFTIGAARRARPSFYETPERATEIWDRVPKSAADAHPAILATFDEAKGLCRDLGLRLPTTAEWDAAAGAGDGRAYPWGAQWIPGACNADDAADAFRYTAPVGSFAQDKSPCGALDVAGNVSEWCDADGKPALRGGNWYSLPDTCKLQHVRNPPAKRSDYVGFRPAIDAP